MPESSLELKILTDSASHSIELESMSLHTTKAFKTLIDSLLQIVELSSGKENIRLRIKAGSAVVEAYGPTPDIDTIQDEFVAIANHESTNEQLVRAWREIQKVVGANGLIYEARFTTGESVTSILPSLKEPKIFKVKSTRRIPQVKVQFLQGKLFEIGGQTPNFHVELQPGQTIKVACTEEQARRINSFLYNTLRFSAWSKEYDGVVDSYQFCDIYGTEALVVMMRALFTEVISQSTDSERLRRMYTVTHNLITHSDYATLGKLIRLFAQKGLDVNYLKTLLVITKGIKDNDSIRSVREELKAVLESQVALI